MFKFKIYRKCLTECAQILFYLLFITTQPTTDLNNECFIFILNSVVSI